MTCGIYLLTNTINGKVYVGQSTNIEERWSGYKSSGPPPRQRKLYNAFRKYGADAFRFEVLEVCPCDVGALNEAEVRLGLLFRAVEDGYTCRLGGRGWAVVGDEARRKISEAHKGKKHSEETKRKISEAQKGKKMSDDARRKMSEAQRGRKLSDEHRRKMSERQKGKKHSGETRRRISESNKGKKKSDEHRRKLSRAASNRSEETRRKISESKRDLVRESRILARVAEGHRRKDIALDEGVSRSLIYTTIKRAKEGEE